MSGIRFLTLALMVQPLGLLAPVGVAEAEWTWIEVFRATSERIRGFQVADGEIRVIETRGLRPVWNIADRKPITEPDFRLSLAPGQKLITSVNGRHVGRLSFVPTNRFRLILGLSVGGQVRTVESSKPATFLISDDGRTVLVVHRDIHRPESSSITIRKLDGDNREEVIEEPRIGRVRMTPDGSRIVVTTSRNCFVYSVGGQRTTLPAADDSLVSPDGRTVIRFDGNRVHLHRGPDSLGPLRLQGPPRAAAFHPTGQRFAVVDRSRLYAIDVASPGTTLTRPATRAEEHYRSVDFAATGILTGKLTVRTAPTRRERGRAQAAVELLNPSTLEVIPNTKKAFELQTWNRDSPRVKFFDDGQRAVVVTPEVVFLLESQGG